MMNTNIAELSSDIENKYLMESMDASVSKHLLDEHFTLVAANHRYYEMFGYTQEEYETLFMNRPDIYYQNDLDDWNKLGDTVKATLQKGESRYTTVCRMRHKDGRRLWIRLVGTFTDDYFNGYRISYSVMMDITDLMQAKIEKDVTQNNFPGLLAKYRITAQGYHYLEGNNNFNRIFGHKPSYEIKEMQMTFGLDEATSIHPNLRNGDPAVFSISPAAPDCSIHYYNVNAQCIDWINGDPIYLMIFSDVTQLTVQKKKLEEYNISLHKLAFSDDITKGYNRRKFNLVANEFIHDEPKNTYAMVWLNIQKFKLINELYGVEAGDRTLVYIFEKLLQHLHPGECCARFAADNFILLLKIDTKKAIRERLNACAQDINVFNEQEELKYYFTFTAGIYVIDDLNISVTTMEDRAHAARKSNIEKKSSLCECNFYSDTIGLAMIHEKDIENKMREALTNEEFVVYLQPKYTVQDQTIAGAEALIRWNDPELGMIPPDQFIPIFEDNGFIVQLDLYVFEQVCKILHRWMKEGRKMLPISVNMSRVHFTNLDFLAPYIKIREKYQIPREYLELELTETMVFKQPEIFINIIKKIHKAGFLCSMDDFGSGYSTLNALKDLDVDTIKLDKAFFSDESMGNEKEKIIVDSVIQMAKSLKMGTVAEGIETKEQTEFLQKTSCDMIQGFVYSRPLSIHDFETLNLSSIDHQKDEDPNNNTLP